MAVVPTKDVAAEMAHVLVRASQFGGDFAIACLGALITRILRHHWGIICARQVCVRRDLT
jgi:hypothetical protein